jgi:fructooligosaccharide transport system permease protein
MELVKKYTKSTLYYAMMFALAAIFIFPLVWMVVSSFKPEAMIFSQLKSLQSFNLPFSQPLSTWLDPYRAVFGRFNMIRAIGNSLMYGTIIVACNIIINSMAAYALARFHFPGKKIIIALIILIMIVPMETGIVPLFVIVNSLHLVNTIPGLVAPAIGSVFNVFLFRQFFLGIPEEMEEAAVLDGAGRMKIFLSIIMPLSKPIIATVAVLTFIGSWNDFLWPLLIFTKNSKMPLQVILNILNNTDPVYTNEVLAALTISTVPIIIIYAIFQRFIVEGISHAGVKG